MCEFISLNSVSYAYFPTNLAHVRLQIYSLACDFETFRTVNQ